MHATDVVRLSKLMRLMSSYRIQPSQMIDKMLNLLSKKIWFESSNSI